MSRLGNVPASINALREHLRRVHKPYAGARFRAVFRKENPHFLTGSVIFCPHEIPARPIADYGVLLFAEHWQPNAEEAVALLSQILLGQAGIAGHQVTSGFTFSDFEHRPSTHYGMGTGGWSGWELRTYSSDQPGPQISHDSVFGFGLRPYRGVNQAINDRVFDLKTDNVGGEVPYRSSMITFLPDTRARIAGALWMPGKLHIELEVNIPIEEVELQVLPLGSNRLPQVAAGRSGSIQIDVPDDSRELLIYLIHRDGDCIMNVHFHHVYQSFGEVPAELFTKSRAESDLEKGEGDQIEFKSFISPHDAKESEIVETVIAFANTSGGRIYVGIADRDATPIGSVELRKCFKGTEDDSIKAQADRLRLLISNRVAPTPHITIEPIRIFDAPVVAITVERGNQTHYDCQNNEVRVRRGASNVRPRPNDEGFPPNF